MRANAWLFLLSSFVATGGTLASGDFDVCKLIASSDMKAVQGEAVLDTKSQERKSGGFLIAQCYYTLPSQTKSVSLEVTRPDPEKGAPSGPRDRWKKLFHGEGDQEGEKESGKPLPVSGVGDEAFWTGNQMVGALYVLKDNSYLRISVGGGEEVTVKIRKAKELAEKALKRLSSSS
jgi:hypothetical protein